MSAILSNPDQRARWPRRACVGALAAVICVPATSRAALLSGETLDTAANVVAWLALIIVPVALIAAFWIVHILPEKVAEKRHHPQLDAIKTLCLLSLLFGGLLWPLAWLWAYTRPVFHRMAYGTDVVDHHPPGGPLTPLHDATVAEEPVVEVPVQADAQVEVEELQRRIRSLEMALAMSRNAPNGGHEASRRRMPEEDEE